MTISYNAIEAVRPDVSRDPCSEDLQNSCSRPKPESAMLAVRPEVSRATTAAVGAGMENTRSAAARANSAGNKPGARGECERMRGNMTDNTEEAESG